MSNNGSTRSSLVATYKALTNLENDMPSIHFTHYDINEDKSFTWHGFKVTECEYTETRFMTDYSFKFTYESHWKDMETQVNTYSI